MYQMAFASRKKIVRVITVERATRKARLFRLNVTLARVKTLSGNVPTESAQVTFSYKFTIAFIS